MIAGCGKAPSGQLFFQPMRSDCKGKAAEKKRSPKQQRATAAWRDWQAQVLVSVRFLQVEMLSMPFSARKPASHQQQQQSLCPDLRVPVPAGK